MSRTYRNRHSVPHGWTVRDDGREYHQSAPTRKAQWKQWVDWLDLGNGRNSHNCPNYYPPPFRSWWTRKEKKCYRKEHFRQYRAKVKDRMRHEDWENIPRFRRTSGWLTW